MLFLHRMIGSGVDRGLIPNWHCVGERGLLLVGQKCTAKGKGWSVVVSWEDFSL